ncbi:hypothetical protein FSARC_11447 [Fusarium sarcochroum]|uniref:Uncharacterized protein n=1 Tax=Fusarium sarcochroum TaxID=1208366 RepID=A0A8H4X0M7_9HYPO|nr:hypothetical protein FSARC_11447 [Fusarium sarcochroum]
MSMVSKGPDIQADCLDLIRGIKNTQEVQNDLLKKLVELMAAPTVKCQPELNFGENGCEKNTSPNSGSIQGGEAQVDKPVPSSSDVADDLEMVTQQDNDLENILRFAPDSYKKRLQIFTIGEIDPRLFRLNLSPPPRPIYHSFENAAFRPNLVPRIPPNRDRAVNTTQSWKYWYPIDWRTSSIKNIIPSPVPDFMPYWQLTRGKDQNWYHIDDTDHEYPIHRFDEPEPSTLQGDFEVPYSYFPGVAYLRAPVAGGVSIETGLTKCQREKIRHSLGGLYAVPEDGRLPLTFYTSNLRTKARYNNEHDNLDKYLGTTRKLLRKLSFFTIIDLTAPGGSQNAVYSSSKWDAPSSYTDGPACWAMAQQALQREEDGFVAYPSVIRDRPPEPPYLEGRWCRVIQLEGLAEITAGILEEQFTRNNASNVWRLLLHDLRAENYDLLHAYQTMINQHLFCQPSSKVSLRSEKVPWKAFHLSWYQLCMEPSDEDIRESTWKYGRLCGSNGAHIKQQAVTIRCFYQHPTLRRNDSARESFWTILIMKPSLEIPSLPRATRYTPRGDRQYRSEDVMLDAILTGLRKAADAWSGVRLALSPIIDHDPLFLDPVQHDNLLFDDDTFSRSRQYFWVVNCLESFQSLIDDAVEEWEQFRAGWPDMRVGIDLEETPEELSSPKTPEELTKRILGDIETQVDRLRDISARFECSRDKTKVLREGLFSASGVIESRVSTRLGENVKLLTYVSIFYLPLSFCVALWSTNENYARPMLVLASVIVAAATFIVVANLRNMTSICSATYRSVKRRIVRHMHASSDERWVQRATAFESYRPERLEVEPSEWYILYYAVASTYSAALFSIRFNVLISKRNELNSEELQGG